MLQKVALASFDGKAVEQHFGRADRFQIYTIDDAGYAFSETRLVRPCCNSGEHEVSAFGNVLAVLTDCAAVVVGKIGPGASDYLTDAGMKVFVAQGYIDDIMKELLKNRAAYFSAGVNT